MVRRGREPGKGLWSVPGGRLEHGEYIADAVKREVKEETGIEIEVGQLLGVFEVLGDPHLVILDHVATAPADAIPQAADDADEARWVRLSEIESLDCTPRFAETLKAWGLLES